jgi:WD40 repeat protein
VAFSPDGKYLLAGSGRSVLTLWEVEGGKFVAQLTCGRDPMHVSAIAFTPDSKRVVVATLQSVVAPAEGAPVGGISVWEIPSGKELKVLDAKKGAFDIAISRDGKQAQINADEVPLSLWDLSEGSKVRDYRALEAAGKSVFLPDGKHAIVDLVRGPAVVDLGTGKVVRRMQKFDGRIRAFTTDAAKAVVGRDDNLILVDLAKGTAIRTVAPGLEVPPGGGGPLRRYHIVAMTVDGKCLGASGTEGDKKGRLLLWTAGVEEPRECYGGGVQGEVNAVAFSPDGRLVCSGETENAVKIWDVVSGRHRLTLIPPEPVAKGVTVPPHSGRGCGLVVNVLPGFANTSSTRACACAFIAAGFPLG